MKTIKILMMAVLTILSVSVFAQDSVKHKAKHQKQKVEKAKYSCPMHPEVIKDKAGACPICPVPALNVACPLLFLQKKK